VSHRFPKIPEGRLDSSSIHQDINGAKSLSNSPSARLNLRTVRNVCHDC
jgi:hypothetical protein